MNENDAALYLVLAVMSAIGLWVMADTYLGWLLPAAAYVNYDRFR